MNKKEQLVFKKNSFLEKELAAKNRELEIEASLERVREKAMAMHASAELKEVVQILFEELRHLDVNLQACLIATFDAVTCDQKSWIIHSKTSEPYSFLIPYNEQPFYQEMLKAWKERSVNWSYMLEGEAKTKWENFLFTDTKFKLLPKEVKEEMLKPEKVFFAASYYQYGAIQASSPELLSNASIDILQRFSKVFDSCYTRFLDLKKAEAQAREAQIQLALERVRARAMAMHNSEELKELISTVSTELGKLDFVLDRAFIMTFDPQTKDSIWWMYNPESTEPTALLVKYHEQPPYLAHLKGWEERQVKWTYLLEGEVKKEWDQFLFTKTELYKLPQVVITNMREKEKVYLYASYNNFGCLSLATLEPITDEQFDILLRFAKVFDLCYTRFNDLKQAEAQAKEAQIQLALERVRARTMAMHSSNELTEVTTLLFQQISSLKIKTWTTGFNVWSDDNNFWVDYVTNPDGGFLEPYRIDATQYPINEVSKAKKRGEEFFVRCEEGEKLAETYRQLGKFGEKQYKAIQDKGFQFPTKQYEHFVFGSKVSLMFITYEPVPEVHDIFKRFGKVFEQTYTRFLDLQKAEAQAREAEIELALERVRARAMAMQKSDELAEAANLLFQQVQTLGVPSWSCGFNIWEEKEKCYTAWMSSQGILQPPFKIPLSETPTFNHFYESRLKGELFYVEEMGGDELVAQYKYMRGLPGFGEILDDFLKSGFTLPTFQINHVVNFKQGNLIFITSVAVPEAIDIFIRFAKVFEQTYTRFLDLKKVEAQAREANIEAALERVRSRSLAMQKSSELKEVITVVLQKLQELGVAMEDRSAVIFVYEEGVKNFIQYVASQEHSSAMELYTPYFDSTILNDLWNARVKGKNVFIKSYSIEEKNEMFNYYFEHTELSRLPEKEKIWLLEREHYEVSVALEKHSAVCIANFTACPLTAENHLIFQRFAGVFEQSYVRFLDLKKAEAQAREAQIQLALERVRARTMAMQKSDELADVATLLFRQVNDLGIKTWTTGFNIWSDDDNAYEDWIASPGGGFIEPYVIDATAFSEFKALSDAKKSGTEFFILCQEGETLRETYKQLSRFATKNQFEKVLEEGFEFPSRQFVHMVFGSKVSLMFITYEPVPEVHDIFKRFGKVFEQTYTRFLDLQKAEAQAREAQIELGLERVRARAMAMQKSDELADAAQLLYHEFDNLGINTFSCGYMFIDQEKQTQTAWVVLPDGSLLPNFIVFPLTGDAVLDARYKDWQEKKPLHVFEIQGEANKEHHRFLSDHVPPFVVQNIFSKIPDRIIFNCANFSDGYLLILATEFFSEEEKQTIIRFAKVFEMTYTRFLDLQKAEAQAKESQIETALEKVRSRTLAMQKSDELADTSAVLFKQLIHLGIAPNRLYIGIIHDKSGEIEFWITDEDGSKVSSKFTGNALNNPSIKKMYDGWAEQKKWIIIDMQGKELREYFHYLGEELRVPFKGGLSQKRRIQYLAYFSKGFLGMASPDEQPNETINLLERFAYVFNLTFIRFNDLQLAEAHALQAEQDIIEIKAARKRAEDTLTELRQTQKQLIQSEKMASLGELTAGIAHEIQNPLNFVNNFSDVNKELIQELNAERRKPKAERDEQLENEILNDLKENEEKINHHGKRADAIVKGMLQHSRSSTGQKEPTDINALADEYLRLSYHGLRAKDKNFNATIETDFDHAVGKINVIPQDIGRVLLNLFNNAFYAVSKRQEAQGKEYEPTVSVGTKKSGNIVLITVTDNGNGIPQKIIDKIFQPFFTTKPTGEGTGLGLSLSYDIAKAHGGEIKVESKEGESTVFIIQIPYEI